jgi:AcrR family transcriptional regulator/DNA-binding XRE family transcriptional regulator
VAPRLNGDLAESSVATVGMQIRVARLQRELSLRTLARRIGVSPATLSQLENGRTRLSVDRLTEIAEALDTTAHAVLATPVARQGQPDAADNRLPTHPEHVLAPSSATDTWRTFRPLTFDAVLDAALQEFLITGYHGSSVRDIARRCGLSVSGLYHYYTSKQEMLATILDLTMTDLLWRSRAARTQGQTPVQRFALLIECLALFHTHRRELGFVGASEMRSLEPQNRRRIAEMRTTQQRMVDEEVDAGVSQGQFDNRRPREAARAVVTMCTALAQWYRTDGPLTPEEIATQYVQFALDLVRHRASS